MVLKKELVLDKDIKNRQNIGYLIKFLERIINILFKIKQVKKL
jgi:hypothetical protein